jgi:hypothetical protein
MLGEIALIWICVPALMLVVFWGCGLLVYRAGGSALPRTLVLPLGFAVVVLVSGFLTTWDATAELAPAAYVALALAGFAVEARRLLATLRLTPDLLWPLLAAAVPFAVFAAPVILSGAPSFTGYGRIVDIAHQFNFAAYLVTEGRAVPQVVDSSFLEMANKTLAIGYPGGWQAALGSFSSLTSVDLAWLYQPFLALTAAMGALSVYSLLTPVVASRPLRMLAAAIAVQANVVYAYGVVGGFKELSAAMLILLVAAVIGHLRPAEGTLRGVIPAAVAVAACLASFNLTVVPWLGVILAGYGILTMGRSPSVWPRVARTWLAFGVLVAALSVPTIIEGSKLAEVAGQAEGSGATVLVDLGNLAAPMPVEAAVGVWPTGDYRFTSSGSGALTTVLIVIVLALASIGVLAAVRRRQWLFPVLAASAAIALAYFVARTGPWIELKAISIGNPIPLVCAFAGAAVLIGVRGRLVRLTTVAGWALALAVSAGVLYGNALAYHESAVAPYERLHDLERLGGRLAGKGPTLYPAHEEYAEYFLRKAEATGMVNPPPPYFFQVRQDAVDARGGVQPFAWDVDELEPDYLQRFRLLVRRRAPLASRPPSNWTLLTRTPWHEVWRRQGDPSRVLFHQPLERFAGSHRSVCRTIAREAAGAPGGSVLAYTTQPEHVTLDLQKTNHTVTWQPDRPGGLLLTTPGRADGVVRLRERGLWQLWLAGSVSRELEVKVDGRMAGVIEDRRNYPEQWERVGTMKLGAGRHMVQLFRGGGDLKPGNGGINTAGPLVFTRATPNADGVQHAPLASLSSLCARSDLDWIEIVAGA